MKKAMGAPVVESQCFTLECCGLNHAEDNIIALCDPKIRLVAAYVRPNNKMCTLILVENIVDSLQVVSVYLESNVSPLKHTK